MRLDASTKYLFSNIKFEALEKTIKVIQLVKLYYY